MGRCFRMQEDGRGLERVGEENEKIERKLKKGGKEMEYYNEYEPHGEVEQCTWQVWGQREEKR